MTVALLALALLAGVATGAALIFRIFFHHALDQRDDARAELHEAQDRNDALWALNKALIGSLLKDIEAEPVVPFDELQARRGRVR